MQLHPSSPNAADAPEPVPSAAHPSRRPPSRLRRRLQWTGGIVALLLLLIFVPPLVNANRYQRQIVRSMSESLGRPVHLDNVTFHLLPVPGLTLDNLVVSEDPEFGSEPTIRANTVEATLRLGSLWRRRVEFSTVRFIQPSVNLVRIADGRWNLSEVLVHASRVDTAPTAQRRAGPAPRFPYIEATGGRVNIKLGQEKLPFALTDAEFALWLPSPDQWSIRLKGQPARTDTNINDPGTIRIEGDLQRSATAAEVPVRLRASWHDEPLGEASLFVAGEDLGWRGTLNLDATLTGTLGAGELGTQLTLNELHRAEFAPAQPLDLQIHCGAGIATERVSLADLRCTMPDNAPTPMTMTAAAVDLAHPESTVGAVAGEAIPLHWGLLWAALFSPRVPTDLHPSATMEVHLTHLSAPAVTPIVVVRSDRNRGRGRRGSAHAHAVPSVNAGRSRWEGTVVVHLPALEQPGAAAERALPVTLTWNAGPVPVPAAARHPNNTPPAGSPAEDTSGSAAQPGDGIALYLQPTTIPLAPTQSVTVSGSLTPSGYTVAVSGSANAAALLLPARYLPQLGDGLNEILPFPPTGLALVRVEFTCTHPWGAPQSCTSALPRAAAPHAGAPGALLLPVPSAMPQPGLPSLLQPHSLSPLDRDPRLGGPAPAAPPPANSPHL